MLVSRACIALALVAAGCSYTAIGELSASACTDNEDNDGDGLNNCRDPDCQAYAHCQAQRGEPIMNPQQPPSRFDASVGVPFEAGSPPDADVDPVDEQDDAGSEVEPPPVDAGALPCDGRCTVTQACIEDVCEDLSSPAAGKFELRILSVEVPDFNQWTRCFDPCAGRLFPSFTICMCAPDPYVEVWRVRQDGDEEMGTLIGSTPVAADARMAASFEDTVIEVELDAGDALWLVVVDEDAEPEEDTTMYRCLPDLRELMPGPIECSAEVVSFLPPYRVRGELTSVQ
jgi:hypothetical protein